MRITAICAAFLLFFFAIPARQLGLGFESGIPLMPGDVGDARLNNYFLENIFLFLQGGSESLWHLGFFAPFPYVLGFSDNLFGSSPIYLAFRYLSFDPSTAFQLWYLFGFFLNYLACIYALRRLGASTSTAILGSVVFCFAIPVTAHAGHAQLHYRFCVPLAFLYFFEFLETKSPKTLTASLAWLVWQFFCGIYIGFFTGMILLASAIGAYLKNDHAFQFATLRCVAHNGVSKLFASWKASSLFKKSAISMSWVTLLALLTLLFYPYLEVSKLYHIKRNWAEISQMLPRLQSYFIADRSLYWAMPQGGFFDLPMRHEHQMFPGLIGAGLFLAAASQARHFFRAHIRPFSWSLMGMGLIVVVTLCFNGFSLWFLFHWLPLASAIRAMSRIDLILLMPMSVVIALGFDHIQSRLPGLGRALIWAALTALLIDFSATSMSTSPKYIWDKQLLGKLAGVPDGIPKDSILFFASTTGSDWSFNPEIDAMWAGLVSGHKVMNGYSGGHPQYSAFGSQYAFDCSIVPQRIAAYVDFARNSLHQVADYKSLMAKVIPVGFLGCDPEWWKSMPTISTSNRSYTREEFGRLRLQHPMLLEGNGNAMLEFEIANLGKTLFAANSANNRPIRVSWRYLNANCQPATGWELRKNLSFDIPPHGSTRMRIALESPALDEHCGVEVSIVQELEFWGHDVGVAPLLVKCKNLSGQKRAC
jgi:hypothetical protein